MAFCGGCGTALRDGARFCAGCGQPTAPPAGKSPAGKSTAFVPPQPSPEVPSGPQPRNRTPVIVAVLGVVAVVVGVAVGLALTGGGDETASETGESDTGSDDSSGDDDENDEGDGGSDGPGPSFSEAFALTLANDSQSVEPGETVVIAPTYSDTSGIESVELYVDGDLVEELGPRQRISTQLDTGNHRLWLVVRPESGSPVRSENLRVTVEEARLGNSIPDSLYSVANEYSNALQNNNWTRVTQMAPEHLGANYEAEWGDIDRQFIVPVSNSGNAVRLGLIVHQFYNRDIPGSGPRTSVYCNVWIINPGARTLVQEPGIYGSVVGENYPPYTDPASLEADVLRNC